jgi:glycosyltransferase involved in cell wall biosynthesis
MPGFRPTRAHFYSGTFTKTIELLLTRGTKISYTAAAHNIDVSRREHEQLGIPFDYPHLIDPAQWKRYVRGYLLADLVICPSTYSSKIMRGYGCERIEIISHGFDPPTKIASMPDKFVVAYLGQPGPDKGLAYLLRAWSSWSQFTHRDACLVIAGRGTLGITSWIRNWNLAGSYIVLGEVDDPADVYNACCVYVQPSASEGFGCEVIEARGHGRPVICSNGVGACALANQIVPACSVGDLEDAIDRWHIRWLANPDSLIADAAPLEMAGIVSWDRIRDRYVKVFSLL